MEEADPNPSKISRGRWSCSWELPGKRRTPLPENMTFCLCYFLGPDNRLFTCCPLDDQRQVLDQYWVGLWTVYGDGLDDVNPGPDLLVDFRLSGAHSGPWKPRKRIRFGRSAPGTKYKAHLWLRFGESTAKQKCNGYAHSHASSIRYQGFGEGVAT